MSSVICWLLVIANIHGKIENPLNGLAQLYSCTCPKQKSEFLPKKSLPFFIQWTDGRCYCSFRLNWWNVCSSLFKFFFHNLIHVLFKGEILNKWLTIDIKKSLMEGQTIKWTSGNSIKWWAHMFQPMCSRRNISS